MHLLGTTLPGTQQGAHPRWLSSRTASVSGRQTASQGVQVLAVSQPSLARSRDLGAAPALTVDTEQHERSDRDRLQQLYEAEAPGQLQYLFGNISLLNLSAQLSTAPPKTPGSAGPGGGKDDDFYANVGFAIRTLREEIPQLFYQDFTYDIYREDVVFRDPRNTFRGLKNYKTIFWSLRFHGNLFFKRLSVDVQRIWQPEDTQIRMRWTVHGIPRLPWDTEGVFDGVSTFRLDRSGKIYEHQVDNVILRDPPMQRSPLFARLNLTPLLQPVPDMPRPCPGAWCAASSSGDNASMDAHASLHAHAAAEPPTADSTPGSGGGKLSSSAAGYALWAIAAAREEALQRSTAAAAAVQGALQQGGGNALQTVARVVEHDLRWARARGLLRSGSSGRNDGGSGGGGLLQGLRRPQRYSQPPFQT